MIIFSKINVFQELLCADLVILLVYITFITTKLNKVQTRYTKQTINIWYFSEAMSAHKTIWRQNFLISSQFICTIQISTALAGKIYSDMD